MRQLKFRAWNKETNHMIDSKISMGSIMRDHVGERIDQNGRRYDQQYIVMQYAYSKDDNGMEIYEGDLLRINPYGEEEYIVEVKTIEGSPFCILTPWDSENDYFMLAAYVRHFGNCEVIGNVHESPELLQQPTG